MTDGSGGGVRARLAAWGGTSRMVDLDGPVHYVDFGSSTDISAGGSADSPAGGSAGGPAGGPAGSAGGPAVVLVHGLGGSHLNWCPLATRLVGQARVLAIDLAGFGLTHPNGRPTTVQANAALLDRFVREVAGTPVVLVGNSMGGMVSIMQAAARPDTVAGLVLVDPALPLVAGVRPDPLVAATFMRYAVPRVGERFLAHRRATLTPRQLVQQVLDLCCVDPTVVPAELIAASVELVQERATVPGLDAAFLSAARSMLLVNARSRGYWAAMRSIRVPVLLMNGERDRLVPIRSARAAAARNPGWQFVVFPNVGHLPQLEAPDEVAGRLLGWLPTTVGAGTTG